MSKHVDSDAAYYIANQVENTPTNGLPTLFIVGMRNISEIEHYLEEAKGIKNIHLGAQGSFYKKTGWNEVLVELLKRDYQVSMEYPPDAHYYLLGQLDEEIWSNRKFIPVISLKLPHLTKLNQNATLKIDDESFEATNDGVYCTSMREVMDSNRFTPWHDYGVAKVLITKTELKLKRFGRGKKSE